MSVLLAALLIAGSPANPQATPTQNAPAAQKKPKQICELIEITGSRSKRRVCRDAEGNLDLGPGVSSSLGGKGATTQQNQGSTPSS